MEHDKITKKGKIMNTIKIQLEKPRINHTLIKMISNNKIDGMIKFKLVGDTLLANIDGLISLKEKFSSEITYNIIKSLFTKLKLRLDELKKYMIFEEDILMKFDYIYLDSKNNLHFLPNFNDKAIDIKFLFNEIMNNCIVKLDEKTRDILEINNYFNTFNYSINGLYENFFEKNEQKFLIHDTIENTVTKKEEISLPALRQDVVNDKNHKSKESFFGRFLNFFKKKPYKVKNLDLDFNLPEKDSKKI